MKVKRTIEPDVSTFIVGDIIEIKLIDGEKARAMAMKQEENGMIFCLTDCLLQEYPMNTAGTNEEGYEASDLRKTLNSEILSRFPADLKKHMIPFDNGDLLRIPTEKEISGENYYGERENQYVTQWKPMERRRNCMAFEGENGSVQWYWLQNKSRKSANCFAYVCGSGTAHYTIAWRSIGVRPVFKLRNPVSAEEPADLSDR